MHDLTLLDADELLALAVLDLDNNRIDNALVKIKTARPKDNCPAYAEALMAKIYAQLKLFNKAEQHFNTFLEANPKALNEKFQLGMVKMDGGDPEAALAIWQEILTEVATHPPSLFYGALAFLNLDKAEDAKRNLAVLLQSAPADNLYFIRAKDLLNKINDDKDNVVPIAPNPAEVYKTEQ